MEKQLKNLFKPFFTTKVEGTGLGLVIVKKILTRMQGHIEGEGVHQGIRPPEKPWKNNKVGGTADGQELGQALYDS